MFEGLNLKQLESFYWVAQLKSFSEAAKRMNITQPGISTRLRELESMLDTVVIERTPRGALLTPKGRELFGLVERLLAIDREWQERLGASGKLSGLIRLGAADTMAMTIVPPLLARIGTDHPNIDVELVVDLSIHLQTRLRQGEIDIAFMAGEMGSPAFEAQPLGEVENAWMCSPALPLPRRGVRVEELARQPVFTHSRGSHHHKMVVGWFEASGARPARLHGCSSLAMMIKLAEAGLGISVLPVPLLSQEIRDGRLRRLDVAPAVEPTRFVVAYSCMPVEPAARAISQLAVSIAKDNYGFQKSRRSRTAGLPGLTFSVALHSR